MTEIPEYPRGGDPARRLRLHHLLKRCRRWSRELDDLCGVERKVVDAPDVDSCAWGFAEASGTDPTAVRRLLRFIDQVDRRREFDRGEAAA